MKFSIQQFIVTSLSVLAVTTLATTATQAAEVRSETPYTAQQLRLAGLDSRNKSFEVSDDFSVQKLRLERLDNRSKGFEVSDGFSAQKLRLEGLDSRNKVGDSLKTTPLIEQRGRVLDRRSGQ